MPEQGENLKSTSDTTSYRAAGWKLNVFLARQHAEIQTNVEIVAAQTLEVLGYHSGFWALTGIAGSLRGDHRNSINTYLAVMRREHPSSFHRSEELSHRIHSPNDAALLVSVLGLVFLSI